MRFISLFAGIGGFDLGLERAGHTCVAQVENDPDCRSLLIERWPIPAHFADVRDVGADTLPPADLVCGGFPCQDISLAGRRAGLAGERSGLWWEFHRIVAECAPRWVLIENVDGLRNSSAGRDLGAILGALGDLGYWWAYRVLDAQFFGLAQRRRRVFVVGCLGDPRGPGQVLLESEGSAGHPGPGSEAWEDPADPPRRSTPSGGSVVNAIRMREGKPGGGKGPLVAEDLSLTLTPGNDQTIVTDTAVRRLTPVECERLQGFPDGWTEGFADTVRYRMLGNAVAVPVAEWIGRRFPA